ncbi:MAG TPA: homoserine dehydrogenase, partial [Candidatus Limnocylindrales bacterium]|nr:homoserine dehydrogenase [Candidatus Limnocylindrales bacterium]
MTTPLRVAVLGAGTVGREVVRALLGEADRLAERSGRRLELVAVAVRDLDRARRAGVPDALLTDAPAHLVASAGNDVVVELIGGEEPARTLIAAALEAGKAVVSANKLVLARHGAALEAVARRTRAALRFEAAVGGGTPVLGPLARDLVAAELRRIRGIVNGTTNYILTERAAAGRPYEEVLREAQALGYAEADPRADVEGDDAVNKLVVLARLGFGAWLDPDEVLRCSPTTAGDGAPGIAGLTDAAILSAAELGLAIRFLATTERAEDGSLAAWAVPTAVPAVSPLGRTSGVLNRIEIDGHPVGRVALEGPGAGGPATSAAILGDLVAVARGERSTWGHLPPPVPARLGQPLAGPRRWLVVVDREA